MAGIGLRDAFGPPPDLRKIEAYIGQRSPEQLWREMAVASFDPTDVLSFADVLSLYIKADDHAIALYSGALQELESHPERAARDTNMMAGWASLFMTCSRCGRAEEAINAFFKASRLGFDDAKSKILVASHLHALGRYRDSLELLTGALDNHSVGDAHDQIPPGMHEVALRLRSALLGKIAQQAPASLIALSWYYSDELEPIPRGMPTLSFAELERKGLHRGILDSLRSAYIFNVSDDRKVWYVAFYDRADPTALIDRNDFGRFMIWFYVDPGSGTLNGFDVMPSR